MIMRQYEYDLSFQLSILSLMAQDNRFVLEYAEVLNAGYFTSDPFQLIGKLIKDFTQKHFCAPPHASLTEELRKFTTSSVVHKESFEALSGIVDVIYSEPVLDKSYIMENVINFGKVHAMNNALYDATILMEKGKLDQAKQVLNQAFSVGMNTVDKGYDYFGKAEDRIAALNSPLSKGTPTGFATLDKYLKGNGILPGFLGFMMAPTSTGKSLWLQNVCSNLLQIGGKSVLFITLEMMAEDAADRLDTIITGMPSSALKDHGEVLLDKRDTICKNSKFEVKKFFMGACNANMIRAHIEFLQSTTGFFPDVILLDHADDMVPNAGTTSENFNDATMVFQELIALAQELRVGIWTASQGNRDSLVKQKSGVNLGMENVSTAITRAQKADIILSLIADPTKKNQSTGIGLAQMAIIKNRHGQKDVTINLNIDYNSGRMTDLGFQTS